MTTETVELTNAIPTAETWTQQALESAQLDLETAQGIEVTNTEEAEFAGQLVSDLGKRAAQVEEMRKDVKRPVLQAANQIDAKFKPVVNTLNEAVGVAKKKLAAYQQEQRRLADERLRAEREQAEKERKEAERRAKRAERRGDMGTAEEERMQAAMTPQPVREEPAAPSSVSTRENWTFEVEDFGALVRAVAKGEVPMDALKPNEQYIRQNVRAQRTAFRWPGVRAWAETTIARKGG